MGILSKPDDCQEGVGNRKCNQRCEKHNPRRICRPQNLREIETVIKAHKTIGPQLEMER